MAHLRAQSGDRNLRESADLIVRCNKVHFYLRSAPFRVSEEFRRELDCKRHPGKVQRLLVPDWITVSSFEFLTRYVYTGSLIDNNYQDIWPQARRGHLQDIRHFDFRNLLELQQAAQWAKLDQLNAHLVT